MRNALAFVLTILLVMTFFFFYPGKTESSVIPTMLQPNVSIDQTTPGVTNGVYLTNLLAGASVTLVLPPFVDLAGASQPALVDSSGRIVPNTSTDTEIIRAAIAANASQVVLLKAQQASQTLAIASVTAKVLDLWILTSSSTANMARTCSQTVILLGATDTVVVRLANGYKVDLDSTGTFAFEYGAGITAVASNTTPCTHDSRFVASDVTLVMNNLATMAYVTIRQETP